MVCSASASRLGGPRTAKRWTPPSPTAAARPNKGARLSGGPKVGGCAGASAPTRSAGALTDDGDLVPVTAEQAQRVYALEAAKARSVARGVARVVDLGEPRSAGDVRSGDRPDAPPGVDQARWNGMTDAQRREYLDANASQIFDPGDPASMTRGRWDSMSSTERTAWINANVQDRTERNRILQSLVTEGFGAIRNFIDSERETRLTTIREGAQTQRENIRAQADVERARIQATVDRARVEADRARAEADAATAAAARATSESTRIEAERIAAEARERALQAQAQADSAAAERARLEAEAARERGLATGNATPFWSSGAGTAVVVVGGVTLVGAAAVAFMAWWNSRQRQVQGYGVAR